MSLTPGSDVWLRTPTASKVPAIVGISRSKSQYTLWHEMTGRITPQPPSAEQQELFDYGHDMEPSAAAIWLRRNPGWRLSRGEVQFRRDDFGFPAVATIDRRASRGRARRIVEMKTARSREEWGDDGSGVVPHDYIVQVCWQQIITGYTDLDAHVVLMPVFGMPRIYTVPYDPELADHLIVAVKQWMESLTLADPPPLDDTVSTYETVRALHPDIEERDAELDPELAADYLSTGARIKHLEKHYRGLKTRVLDAMGNAKTASAAGRKIADRRPNSRGSVSLYAAKTNPEDLIGETA